MALQIIIGPPNSGRTGAILDRFTEALPEDPLLVVPTSDDVERFERELCSRKGGALGGSVTSLPGLVGEVARACGAGSRPSLSRMQRIWLCRAAARGSRELRLLSRSAASEGFAPALEGLISELQAAGLDAAAFAGLAEAAADADPDDGSANLAYERELAGLFADYERRRDALGSGDEHTFAAETTAALRREPAAWGERPVLLYGFDDLSREQVELIDALGAAAPVTIAVAWEPRAALDARAGLIRTLRDELGGEVIAELEPDSTHTDSATLFHLERNLFSTDGGTAASDGSLQLLVSAGERGEAELIGRRIARLIAAGTDPDRIAVAVRSPDRQAPILARVLGSLGVPAAAEARVPLARTATGTTLLRLLALAGGEAEVADLLAFLRGPARAHPGAVDFFEREVVRGRIEDTEEAIRRWEESSGHEIWGLSMLRDERAGAEGLAAAIAELASDIAEYPYLRMGPVPAGDTALELRAAAEVRRACAEAAALGADAPSARRAGRAPEPCARSPVARADRGPRADPQPLPPSRDPAARPLRRRAHRRQLPGAGGLRPAAVDRAAPGARDPGPQRPRRRGALPVLRLRLPPRGAPVSELVEQRPFRRRRRALSVRRGAAGTARSAARSRYRRGPARARALRGRRAR